MKPLPIDEQIPAIAASLRRTPRLVLRAPPGAGKTTRVPPALLDHGLVPIGREVVVLEPRRLAARMAARRVAQERHGDVGGEVGYRVRFESVVSERTRLCYETEGVLLRSLLRDPALEAVGAVVLDEFHERSADVDLTLAFLREVQATVRPDLLLLVMSATLEVNRVAGYLDDCPILESAGRLWPVEVQFRPGAEVEPPEERIGRAVRQLWAEGTTGGILVFVPGAAEIRRTLERIGPEAAARGYQSLPLHGDLPPEEQDRAVLPAEAPRLIVATNVAEASITVEGIEAVIDSGLARVARYDPRTELNRLVTTQISQASARQRAGRAGRTAPGRCLRLYSEGRFAAWPEEAEPEICRIELSETALRLLAWGARDPRSFEWLDPPPPARLERALRYLDWIGAARAIRDSAAWELTALGRSLLRYPLPPRLGRILVEAERRGCRREAAPLAALLAERDLRLSTRAFAERGASGPASRAPSDLLERADDLATAARLRFDSRACAAIGIDARVARRVDQAARQLLRLGRDARAEAATAPAPEEDLLAAVAAGYPDRVVRRRAARSTDGLMVGGAGVRLEEDSAVRDDEIFLALDAVPERDARGARVRVRAASAISLSALRQLFPALFREEDAVEFDVREERMIGRRRTLFLDLPLLERETGRVEPAAAGAALFTAAWREPERAIALDDDLERLLGRVRWLLRFRGLPAWPVDPPIDDPPAAAPRLRGAAGPLLPAVLAALRTLCPGCRSFDDLRRAPLASTFRGLLPSDLGAELDRLAPDRLTLPSGRTARLAYTEEEPPILASRLQDFFGLDRTPCVGGGTVPVRLHLLAPSQRPVQVTQDLASFWRTTYPRLRLELKRRYPKHAWPEDPRVAPPPRAPQTGPRGSASPGGASRARRGRR